MNALLWPINPAEIPAILSPFNNVCENEQNFWPSAVFAPVWSCEDACLGVLDNARAAM
jgi:hypothetical protein